MKTKQLIGAALLSVAAAGTSAAPLFVGSWDLYSGETWVSLSARIYSAQEAAALLFGGAASEYLISTNGTAVADINSLAWYDTLNHGTSVHAHDYLADSGAIGVYDVDGDASAMIRDNAFDLGLINYAFRDASARVPEPLTIGLVGLGLLGMASARRRLRRPR